jgi:hypothetical protein
MNSGELSTQQYTLLPTLWFSFEAAALLRIAHKLVSDHEREILAMRLGSSLCFCAVLEFFGKLQWWRVTYRCEVCRVR